MNRITSEMLISLKNRTDLTVEKIAQEAGVPLGTAQKIFAGITKNPRASAAQALYACLSGCVSDGGKSSDGLYSRSYLQGNLAKPLRKPGQYTTSDYRSLPDDLRCELIDGFFYDMGSPSTIHQRISTVLSAAFFNYIHGHEGSCEVFTAPFDVQLDCDDRTMVQPDLLVVCHPDRIREWGIYGAPDLVVEILSPSTERKDRALKTMKYAAAGVREYWLADPSSGRIIVHRFDEDIPPAFYSFEQEVPVGIFGEDLKIRLADWNISGYEV